MKKTHLFRWFNLIEVTMAVAVVGIGIAGVMALFPPAIEANKNADFQNFTGAIINNVATYVDYNVKYHWATFIKGSDWWKEKASATTPPTQTGSDGWRGIENFAGLFYTAKVSPPKDVLGIQTQNGSITAHVRIWKVTDTAQLSKGYFDGANNSTPISIPSGSRVRIVVELSWPIHMDYEKREKQEFVYEFNKPEEPPAADPDPGD